MMQQIHETVSNDCQAENLVELLHLPAVPPKSLLVKGPLKRVLIAETVLKTPEFVSIEAAATFLTDTQADVDLLKVLAGKVIRVTVNTNLNPDMSTAVAWAMKILKRQKSTIYEYVHAHEVVEKWKLTHGDVTDIGCSRLALLWKVIDYPGTKIWVEKAKTLSCKNLKTEVMAATGGALMHSKGKPKSNVPSVDDTLQAARYWAIHDVSFRSKLQDALKDLE